MVESDQLKRLLSNSHLPMTIRNVSVDLHKSPNKPIGLLTMTKNNYSEDNKTVVMESVKHDQCHSKCNLYNSNLLI